MTTALATTTIAGLTPNSIDEAEKIAEKLATSTLVPEHFKGKPADCFMAIAYGVELGLPPVTALASIAVVKGKPTLYANTMVALILSSHKALYFHCVESSEAKAVYETQRVGAPGPQRYEFTMEQAKAAGLTAPPKYGDSMYAKYAKQMLESRAKSFLARDVYPDVLHGLQSYEEVIDIEPTHSVDVERFEAPDAQEPSAPELPAPAAQSVADSILACKTIQELEAFGATLGTLDGEEREQAKALYRTHRVNLEGAQK